LIAGAATTLLEAKLLSGGQASWVERTEIDRVLKEQVLATAFGAQGGKNRLALGKLLKAEVLVLVRSVKSNDNEVPPSIECIVCETRQGLRLQVAAVPADGKDEATAAALEAVVRRGLARHAEKITAIVAVPPLVSDDLGFEHNYLQSAYAKLIEQVLLETPGLVVVELAEAQAIAEELLLAGPATPVERAHLPLYLLGNFRHDGTGDKQTVSLDLRLVRGQQELARHEERELAPAEAPAWLRKHTLASLPQARLTPAKKTDSATEAKLLAARGNEFLKIGNANEALALFEASLLLQPEQPQVQRGAARACERLMRVVPVADLFSEKPLERALGHLKRGLTHLESYLQSAGPLWELRRGGAIDITFTFPQPGLRLLAPRNDSRACATLREQAGEEAAQSYLRIDRSRAQRGFLEPEWLNYALFPLEQKRQVEVAVTAIEETADLPNVELRIRGINLGGHAVVGSTAGGNVVARLLESKSDKVRTCALAIKKEMEARPPAAPRQLLWMRDRRSRT
jgi:tetratricopeptide (TPR) repeat protein